MSSGCRRASNVPHNHAFELSRIWIWQAGFPGCVARAAGTSVMATVADETFPWLHVTFILMYKARHRHSPASEHPLALRATWTTGNKAPGGAAARAGRRGLRFDGGERRGAGSSSCGASARAPASSRRPHSARLSLAYPRPFFFFCRARRRETRRAGNAADARYHVYGSRRIRIRIRPRAERREACESAEKRSEKKNGGRCGGISPFSASLSPVAHRRGLWGAPQRARVPPGCPLGAPSSLRPSVALARARGVGGGAD